MGYYETIWEDRKRMTFTSLIAGGIIGLIVAIATCVNAGYGFWGDLGQGILMFLIITLFLTAMIIIIRSIHQGSAAGVAAGAGVGILASLIGAIASSARGGGIGLVLSFCMLIIFLFVLLVVAAIYAIYIPISDIYYFVKAKQERATVAGSESSDNQ